MRAGDPPFPERADAGRGGPGRALPAPAEDDDRVEPCAERCPERNGEREQRSGVRKRGGQLRHDARGQALPGPLHRVNRAALVAASSSPPRVPNGRAALDLARTRTDITLILTDQNMPLMSGIDLPPAGRYRRGGVARRGSRRRGRGGVLADAELISAATPARRRRQRLAPGSFSWRGIVGWSSVGVRRIGRSRGICSAGEFSDGGGRLLFLATTSSA